MTYSFVKCGCRIYFFLISANRVQIFRCCSKNPLDFAITRVDCRYIFFSNFPRKRKLSNLLIHIKYVSMEEYETIITKTCPCNYHYENTPIQIH